MAIYERISAQKIIDCQNKTDFGDNTRFYQEATVENFEGNKNKNRFKLSYSRKINNSTIRSAN